MDLFGIFRIAMRRWYVLVAALVVTGIIGFVASRQVAPSYQVGGVLVVNIPYAQDEAAAARLAGNPYYDTRTAASVIASLADSPDVRGVVAQGGGTPDYTITLDSGRPVLMVTITTKSQDQSLQTYTVLWKELERRMAALQEVKKIPQEFRVTVDDALAPKEAAASTGSRSKVLLAAMALGVVLALGLSVYVDYLLRRRAARESGADTKSSAAAPPPPPVPASPDERGNSVPAARAAPSPRPSPHPPPPHPSPKPRPVELVDEPTLQLAPVRRKLSKWPTRLRSDEESLPSSTGRILTEEPVGEGDNKK